MVDLIASQPVRTELVTEPVVVSRDLNQNAVTNTIFVELSDGTTSVSVTSGSLDINIAAVGVTAVPVSADSNANAETNPIFVQIVSGAVSGIEVVDFNTAAAVAKDATSNHDFTVTSAKTLKVNCINVAASGAAKWEVQSGPLASLTTNGVWFTSASVQSCSIPFKSLLEVPDTGTGTLRIIRTNRDNQSQDLYSTILGTEV